MQEVDKLQAAHKTELSSANDEVTPQSHFR